MELLSDPVQDRALCILPSPPHRALSHELLFPNSSYLPDCEVLKVHLRQEGRLSEADLLALIDRAKTLFKQEPNVLTLQDPITVVGDIHGQYFDLLKLLDLGGHPESSKYLFLGDYVDRGCFSIEVVALLCGLKIRYPRSIYMIRGNHECRQMTAYFNFRAECLAKFSLQVYERIMECFDCLPLACILNEKFLCIHGGLSPELKTIEDLQRIYRFLEPPRLGLFCDILWADPVDHAEGALKGVYKSNGTRGCSYFYGVEAANRFFRRNNLISIIRAHEAQLEGYKMHRWEGSDEFPTVITLFSAPNYCDVYNNKAAIIQFQDNTMNIQQFSFTEHPYVLPEFMDVFTWSVPFVIDKVAEIMVYILKAQSKKGVVRKKKSPLMRELADNAKKRRRNVVVAKVRSVGRVLRLLNSVRQKAQGGATVVSPSNNHGVDTNSYS